MLRVDSSRRCALRSSPPSTIAEVNELGGVAIAWDGARFGVAWGDLVDGEREVRFVRVGADGARLGTALRVNEPRTQGTDPSLAWNGTSWVIVWSGGLHELDDVYQGRVDARGTVAGRPWRMTRGRERVDLAPRIVSHGEGFGLAWVARTSARRWRLYAQALDRFDAPRAFPATLLDTAVTLASTQLVWSGAQWGVAALGVQSEVLHVELARMDARGFATGSRVRATPGPIGGAETEGRFALAWDGDGYVVAWSEVTQGASHVFLRRLTPRGTAAGAVTDLRDAEESARSPALQSLGEGGVVAAWVVSREGRSRLRVRTIERSARVQEGGVEVQDHDGDVGRPVLALGDGFVAVLSVSARALTFHRVALGPCPVRSD